MNHSEAAYFDGDHCQHVADRDEQQRLARKRQAFARNLQIQRRSKAR